MSDLDEPLSERELEILRQVATGASNKEIASALVISPNTVKVHLRNIFTKIGVVSRTEATLYAIKHGFVDRPQSGDLVETPGIHKEPFDLVVPDSPLGQVETILADPIPLGNGRPAAQWIYWVAAGATLTAVLIIILFLLRPPPVAEPTLQPIQPNVTQAVASRWTEELNMPGKRVGMSTFFYNNSFFIIGGNDGKSVVPDLFQFDENTSKWLRMASKPTATEGMRALLVGERVYLPGGKTANGQPSSLLEVYDPRQNSWSTKAALPTPLSDYAAAAFEGQLYIFGGWTGKGYSDQVLIYNPQTDTWSSGSPLPSGRALSSAEVYGGKILLAGGYDGANALADVLVYMPTRDTPEDSPWENGPALPSARYGMSSTSLANMVYLFGGKGPAADQLPSLTLQPESKSWVEIENPDVAPTFLGAAQPAGNFIHLFGGFLDTTPTDRHLAYQAIYTISIPFTNSQ